QQVYAKEVKENGIVTSGCPCQGEHHYDESLMLEHLTEVELSSILPSSVDISSSTNPNNKYLPPVQRQKGGSCVAYSIAYTQFSYEVNRMLDREVNGTNTYYSPMFVYNTFRKDTTGEGGMNYDTVYKFLQNHGNLLWCDFNPESVTFNTLPSMSSSSKQKLREALNIRISSDYHSTYISSQITQPQSASLNSVKSLLNQGRILHVNSNFNANAGGVNDSVLYRCMTTNTGHSLIVVGYDDTFKYDVNGDGIFENAEIGAFKILNSWGPLAGDNGYYWVMYDALNEVSAISGNWESTLEGKRISAFTSYIPNWNLFTWIDVEEKDVCVIGELTCTASYQDESIVSIKIDPNISSYTMYNRIGPHAQRALVMMFDYDTVTDVKSHITDGMYHGVYIEDISAGGPIYSIRWRVVDSLGVPLSNTVIIPNTDNYRNSYISSCAFPKGDVNYDGVLNTGDASTILQYVNQSISFSRLQLFLGDYNHDGVVNTGDAFAIMAAIG
ncbi:MAG: hypothetical protein GX802_07600, partial [Clostridiales bacterium]|nr:hypothetical protein [Clostridiales bacterium]